MSLYIPAAHCVHIASFDDDPLNLASVAEALEYACPAGQNALSMSKQVTTLRNLPASQIMFQHLFACGNMPSRHGPRFVANAGAPHPSVLQARSDAL